MYRGTLEEGDIGPGWMLLGFCEVDVVEGRQRKVASLREWMQSGMFLGF